MTAPAGGEGPPIHDVLAEMVRYAELAVELLDRLTEDSAGALRDARVRKVEEDEPLVARAREIVELLSQWLTEAEETIMGRAFAQYIDFQRRQEEEQ